jgi:hypothetical protein
MSGKNQQARYSVLSIQELLALVYRALPAHFMGSS